MFGQGWGQMSMPIKPKVGYIAKGDFNEKRYLIGLTAKQMSNIGFEHIDDRDSGYGWGRGYGKLLIAINELQFEVYAYNFIGRECKGNLDPEFPISRMPEDISISHKLVLDSHAEVGTPVRFIAIMDYTFK